MRITATTAITTAAAATRAGSPLAVPVKGWYAAAVVEPGLLYFVAELPAWAFSVKMVAALDQTAIGLAEVDWAETVETPEVHGAEDPEPDAVSVKAGLMLELFGFADQLPQPEGVALACMILTLELAREVWL